LFYNTPARLKFLKNESTESRLIIDFISKMALAYPAVRMRLINNGNVLYSTTGKGDVISNIYTVYSPDTGKSLIRIKSSADDATGMQLEAYVSPPNITKTNRKSQIFFVNGRSITSDILAKSVSEAYREKMFEGRHPVVFLFLTLNPAKLDVNIHPNKKEVRFDDEKAVREFVAAELRKGLYTKEAVPEISVGSVNASKKEAPTVQMKMNIVAENVKAPGKVPASVHEKIDIKSVLKAKRLAEAEEKYSISSDDHAFSELADTVPNGSPQSSDSISWVKSAPVAKRFDIKAIEPAGTLFSTYIIGKDTENLYLIDQHASHERVFYEKFLNQYLNAEKYTQTILTPIIINTTYAIKDDSDELLNFLNSAGFDIEEFGPRSFAVKGIPEHMSLSEAETFLNDFIDNAGDSTDFKDQRKIEKLVSNSCKTAVKANYNLKPEEIKNLMDDLAATDNPFTCPHGRPTIVKMTKHEIEKMFKRV